MENEAPADQTTLSGEEGLQIAALSCNAKY